MFQSALTLTLIPVSITARTIWEVGMNLGGIPEVDVGGIDSFSFFEKYHKLPFVVRGFHETLEELAVGSGYTDAITWLQDTVDMSESVDSVEGELRETRLAPTLNKVKWKYFFEKFRKMDIYAVTQAPLALRDKLRLFPTLSCGGLSAQMSPPHIWVSGGTSSSKSVLHSDSYLNQHCVLKGSKKFMMIPPNAGINSPEYGWVVTEDVAEFTTPGYEEAYGEFGGLLDTDNVDLEKYPKWESVPWISTELKEGDCIFMPYNWYHYVESKPEPTISWHNWFYMIEEFDNSECLEEPLRTSQCIYKEDKHTIRGREYFSKNPDRSSFCE
jgi:hypothetical protein